MIPAMIIAASTVAICRETSTDVKAPADSKSRTDAKVSSTLAKSSIEKRCSGFRGVGP
jgi:hypothetical protein